MTENTLHLLIADDESGMRTGIARSLEKLEIQDPDGDTIYVLETSFAADGAEAREHILQHPVDLLLLDHGMPRMTGMELLEELADRQDPPLVIMITAYASLEMAVKATKQGAFDFLAKPFTPRDLKNTVEKAARHLIARRTARRLADEKKRVRFEFLSILAHELKAPIGAVESYLRLLEEGITDGKPETQERIVGRCLVRLDGMRKLIYDLLDLTRIESGQKKRELAKVDLVRVAQRVVETYGPTAGERGIEVFVQSDGNTVMQGDESELEIILNNLMSNAVKYNRDGGRVDLQIHEEPERLLLEVRDTGIGMTEEEVGRLFGEFVRIKNEKTSRIEGSGLGLSILRRLAHLNGGEVLVRSVPDEGTTFTVTLSRTGVAS